MLTLCHILLSSTGNLVACSPPPPGLASSSALFSAAQPAIHPSWRGTLRPNNLGKYPSTESFVSIPFFSSPTLGLICHRPDLPPQFPKEIKKTNPGGTPREVVIKFLHDHVEMIDLNPLVKERHPIRPPPGCPDDEASCTWYSLTDRIAYLPGGLASGDASYTCAFHNLPSGIQTHCRAPLGVDILDRWTLGGRLPGEQPEPVELGIGAPPAGQLYIREDVDLRCNLLMTGFVRKNLTRAHATLVDRLVERARVLVAEAKEEQDKK